MDAALDAGAAVALLGATCSVPEEEAMSAAAFALGVRRCAACSGCGLAIPGSSLRPTMTPAADLDLTSSTVLMRPVSNCLSLAASLTSPPSLLLTSRQTPLGQQRIGGLI